MSLRQPAKMAPAGKKCGNKLFCGHVCRGRPGEGHMCSCPLKWTIDPGCGHLLAGNCSRSLTAAIAGGCLATCGRILECQHTCKESCSSRCVCPDPNCNSKNSLANQVATIVVITPAAVQQENEQHGDKSIAADAEMETEVQPSVGKPMKNLPPPPPSQIPTVKHVPINRTPVLKLTTPQQPSPFRSRPLEFGNSRTSPQPSTSRAAANQNEAVEFFRNRVNQSDPNSVDKLSENQMEQILKLLPASARDPTVKNPNDQLYVFTQCKNGHVFGLLDDFCPEPECRCPPIGPQISLSKKGTPLESNADQVPAEMLQQMLFSQEELDNAWKLGLAKCSLNHLFPQDCPRCPICQEPSMFYMEDDD